MVHDLHGDLAVVAGIVREEYSCHPTGAKLALEQVAVG